MVKKNTTDILIKGVPNGDLLLFDYYCKELNLTRSDMIRYVIKNVGKLPEVLEAEIRYQKFAKDVKYSLDLNTKALIKAIEYGIVQSPIDAPTDESSEKVGD